MKKPFEIPIGDYDYALPESRIAKYPLKARDDSKLLIYRSGRLEDGKFRDLPRLLPENSLLVFNETRVIQARLEFYKSSGARIEVFCLEPVMPANDFQLAVRQPSPVTWKCLVGNAKRWRSGRLEMHLESNGHAVTLYAERMERLDDAALIRFSWEPPGTAFGDIVEKAGLTPLPPYLNRKAEQEDKWRYQTVYARNDGSVAAPTAGLHFTDDVFKGLEKRGVKTAKVTLHVGAGTFRPVVSESIADHRMHGEKIVVQKETLKRLISHLPDPIIPVGTTSMRTLESLFWLSVKLPEMQDSMIVEQWDPYSAKVPEGFDPRRALEKLVSHLDNTGADELHAETRLMIAPGYDFKICNGIVTNFHQPKSTLLLLIAALIGDDWRSAYEYALKHEFRFLSYGDSCLFLP